MMHNNDDCWFEDDDAPQPEHDNGLGENARAHAAIMGTDPDEGDFADIWENLIKNNG